MAREQQRRLSRTWRGRIAIGAASLAATGISYYVVRQNPVGVVKSTTKTVDESIGSISAVGSKWPVKAEPSAGYKKMGQNRYIELWCEDGKPNNKPLNTYKHDECELIAKISNIKTDWNAGTFPNMQPIGIRAVADPSLKERIRAVADPSLKERSKIKHTTNKFIGRDEERIGP